MINKSPQLIRTTLLLLALLLAPVVEAGASATILTYHVIDSPRDSHFTVSRAELRRQLEYLAATGYNVIPLSQLVDYLVGKVDSIPENSLVITIDDGWRSTYTHFYPELRRFGYPFTAFIYPNFVGQGDYALTWEQVREMANDGVDIQSHTLSHSFLSRRRQRRMSGATYARWLKAELEESRKTIERATRKPVRFLAYPYGDYDAGVVEAARAAGYAAAFTSNFGAVARGDEPLRLNRVVIDRQTTLATFRAYLGVGRLELASSTPSGGRSFDERNPVIEAAIRRFESLDPSTVGLAVLGLDSTRSFYDARSGRVSTVIRDALPGERQTVVVWGRDRKNGQRREAVWEFYGSELERKAAEMRRSRQIARSADKGRPAADWRTGSGSH